MPKRLSGPDSNHYDAKKHKSTGPSFKQDMSKTSIQHLQYLEYILDVSPPYDIEHHHAGIVKLSTFLSTLSTGTTDECQSQQSLLLEYFRHKATTDNDGQPLVCMPGLMQTWADASRQNRETLLVAIPSLLCSIVRTMSSLIAFQEHGINVCRTILQAPQLKLLARGLNASETKGYLITPCLELLTEICSFDGGAVANEVHRHRELTWTGLARNLSLTKALDSNETEQRSNRSSALAYVSAILKFCSTIAKVDLLNQRSVVSAMLRDFKSDSATDLEHLLDHLKEFVAQDEVLHVSTKARFFSAWVLGRIISIYGLHTPTNERESEAGLQDRVRGLLIFVCTSICADTFEESEIDLRSWIRSGFPSPLNTLNLESRDAYDLMDSVLKDFAIHLRPWAHSFHSELLLAMFRAHPRQVGMYFGYESRLNYPLGPKMSDAWVGESAFIFSVAQLPLPKDQSSDVGLFGWDLNGAQFLENILPSPAGRSVLTNYLHQSPGVVRFFAIRLLVVAFEKLSQLVERNNAYEFSANVEDMTPVLRSFARRCPDPQVVISAFRTTPKHDLVQREAIARLLSLYYSLIPMTILRTTVDVSEAIDQALEYFQTDQAQDEDLETRHLEFGHLLHIASCSQEMQWFRRSGSLKTAPLTNLLRLQASGKVSAAHSQIEQTLCEVIDEMNLFPELDTLLAVRSFIGALRSISEDQEVDHIWKYIDECLSRYRNNSGKYWVEWRSTLSPENGSPAFSEKVLIDPFIMTLMEQWSFFHKLSPPITESDLQKTKSLVGWIDQYTKMSVALGRDSNNLAAVIRNLSLSVSETNTQQALLTVVESLKGVQFSEVDPYAEDLMKVDADPNPNSVRPKAVTRFRSQVELFKKDCTMDEESALVVLRDLSDERFWIPARIEAIVQSGVVESVIRCLSCPTHAIRAQARDELIPFNQALESSHWSEKTPMKLLVEETLLTTQSFILHGPFPSYLGAFSAQAVKVLSDPLHPLYEKVNKFLQSGPQWSEGKIPLFYKIISQRPTEDYHSLAELQWLLVVLMEGLRTPEDFDVYRRRSVFEQLMSIYNTQGVNRAIKEMILAVLYIASGIEGGSTTLITRAGALSWIKMTIATNDEHSLILVDLLQEIVHTADASKLKSWTGEEMEDSPMLSI